MKKKSIVIVSATILLLSIVLSGCRGFWPLSRDMKDKVEEAYRIRFGLDQLTDEEYYASGFNMKWFDECGKRDSTVFRYFGSYGDCIVLLGYSDANETYTISNLARPVEIPRVYCIYLYNTNPDYPNAPLPGKKEGLKSPLALLADMKQRGISWLTDEELEQLTTDLENWVAAGNY